MNWNLKEVLDLYNLPFNELVFRAHNIYRENFPKQEIQISTIISIKTGGCPENCNYCGQSAHFNTGVIKTPLMNVKEVVEKATIAKDSGATRFCMGAAWRSLHNKDLPMIKEIIAAVKDLELEICITLGMLTMEQAIELKEAGLDYYNHNLDTSREYYPQVATTRTYDERLETIKYLRQAGLKVCCGGIIGMGEQLEDRLKLLINLANLSPQPESVPINMLAKTPGTPYANMPDIDILDFIRIIAVARMMLPKSMVRLSAGRSTFSDEAQALCFFAGANSIHFGFDKIFLSKNPDKEKDIKLLNKLGAKFHIMEEAC